MRRFLFVLLMMVVGVAHARILHVGNDTIQLSQTKATTPALHVRVGDEVWYGNMTHCPMPMNENTDKKLRVKYNDADYYVSETDKDYVIVDGKLVAVNCNVYLQNESGRKNYIDLGVVGTGVTRVEMEVRNVGPQGVSSSNFFGSRNTYSSQAFALFATYNGYPYWFFNYYDNHTEGLRQADNDKHFISFGYTGDAENAVIGSVDGVVDYKKEYAEDFKTPGTLYLFHVNGPNANDKTMEHIMNIYYVKLYENNVLIRHFIPVPRGLVIGDFVVPENGMWDIVEQKFYGNMGSGEFIYGVDGE